MRFLGKKKDETKPISTDNLEKEPNYLEQLCGNDKLLYQDLSGSMYLKPKGLGTYSDGIKKAKELEIEEKRNDAARAYQHAGCLALYEGNVEGVKKAFDKRAELSEKKFPRIRAVPEKAVEIVRQYFLKFPV